MKATLIIEKRGEGYILDMFSDRATKRRYLLNAGRAAKPAPRSDKGISRATYPPSNQQQIAATAAW